MAGSRRDVQYVSVAVLVFVIHPLMLIFPDVDWLPSHERMNSFIGAIWQVHATIIGITVILVTIIITVIANEGDRTRIWNLYRERTRISLALWFNLLLILSEGLAFLETLSIESPLIRVEGDELLGLSVFFLFGVSIIGVFLILTETFRFLNQDHVENLFEAQTNRAVSLGFADDLRQRLESMRKWKEDHPDGS